VTPARNRREVADGLSDEKACSSAIIERTVSWPVRAPDVGRSPYTLMGADIALNHHEHWDGSGYPSGRKGEDIPPAARIMQICDVYDALRSRRPYKPRIAHEAAVKIISQGDGRTQPGHFDPSVLACFLRHAGRFGAIYDQHGDG
jgi:putative two-component system response regulator